MIEVERRTFITKEKYEKLLDYFQSQSIETKAERQVTSYLKEIRTLD